MKKIFLLSALFGLLISAYGQPYQVLSSPFFVESMRDVKFIDATTGWLVGNKGTIYKTTDSGLNWILQSAGTEKDLVKAFFLDANTGWTATVDGSIFKTTDGGDTWTEYNYSVTAPWIVFAICDLVKFIDQNTGFMLAGKLRNIYLLKTIDGGITWSIKDSLVHNSTARRWYDIDFNGNNGIMVGDKKDIQKYTTDLGETWTSSTSINDAFFRDLKYVKFLTPTEVIAIGEGNEFSGVPVPVYKSTDAGVNWVKKNQSFATVYDRVRGAYFKNALEGYGVGSDGFSKAFVVKTTDGGETWTHDVLDYAFGLQALAGSGDFLFALGTSSHFIYSNDFGTTWQFIAQKPPAAINNICFFNGKGYAVSRNGDVYYSDDGTGNSWVYHSNAGRNNSGDVVILPNEEIVILKENRHVVKSTDFGLTWQTKNDPVVPNARNLVGGLDFGDQNTGYAWFSQSDYGNYYVLKTSDAGESWTEIKFFAGPGYISGDVVAFDADNVILLGPDLWTQRSVDGGANWEPVTLNNFPASMALKDFEGVAKIDGNRAIAIGDGFICKTTDKGASWDYIDHGLTDLVDSLFYKITFSGDTLGYISLYDGTILKTTDLGATWTLDNSYVGQHYFFASALNQWGDIRLGTSTGYILGKETEIVGVREEQLNPIGFELSQNYPNPFNPLTKIKYSIPSSTKGNNSNVKLIVYDVLGNEVVTLVNEQKSPGSYEVIFNSSNVNNSKSLTSGVYFYQLKVDGVVTGAKKMLLLK
ncbi:MAG TPA: YCF48-related protein [Ignavibacteriaceae bacterium]|nr:YCF48-related protein [Ignavibacteriaceae bacterium]